MTPSPSFPELTVSHSDVARALNLVGLLLSFVGTVIIWRNSAPAGGQASYWMDGAASRQIAERGARAQRRLRAGLCLLAAGFAFQFVAGTL